MWLVSTTRQLADHTSTFPSTYTHMADNTDTVPEVPLALVSNAFLEGKIAQMRNRPVPWEVCNRMNMHHQSHGTTGAAPISYSCYLFLGLSTCKPYYFWGIWSHSAYWQEIAGRGQGTCRWTRQYIRKPIFTLARHTEPTRYHSARSTSYRQLFDWWDIWYIHYTMWFSMIWYWFSSTDHEEHVRYFHDTNKKNPGYPFEPLFKYEAIFFIDL
jgi:hypothetical protein